MTLAADQGTGRPMVCPFVAFADERDLRAAEPDHRHRCYAEPRPAPRALAHQARFCLSPGFTSCPTFQDWATREAARVEEGTPTPALAAMGIGAGDQAGLFDKDAEPETAAAPAAPSAAGASAAAVSGSAAMGAAAASLPPAPQDVRNAVAGNAVGRSPYGADRFDEEELGEGADGAAATRGVADWDRPRPRRDYPRLEPSRGAPRILVGLAVLVIAALVLFLLPSFITRILGGREAAGSATPFGSVLASGGGEASPSGEPTAVPTATPLTYTVVAGDTLTKIAKKFNVTVAEILAANPTIKNADTIAKDQVIVIPTPGASPSPSPSP